MFFFIDFIYLLIFVMARYIYSWSKRLLWFWEYIIYDNIPSHIVNDAVFTTNYIQRTTRNRNTLDTRLFALSFDKYLTLIINICIREFILCLTSLTRKISSVISCRKELLSSNGRAHIVHVEFFMHCHCAGESVCQSRKLERYALPMTKCFKEIREISH